MYYCEVCDKICGNTAAYMKHLHKSFDDKHKMLLLSICQKEINVLHKDIILKDVFLLRGRRYYTIYNTTCGHTSIIRWDGLRKRSCADIVCTGGNKSKSMRGKAKSVSHKKHIREAQNRIDIKRANKERTTKLWCNENYKNKVDNGRYNNRWKHALNIAKKQREKGNSDELLFLNILKEHNYYVNTDLVENDMWQVPYIDENVEYIFDFYIKELNIYVNIDGEIHKNIQEIKIRDSKQDKYCLEKGINLCRLNENNLHSIFKEVV